MTATLSSWVEAWRKWVQPTYKILSVGPVRTGGCWTAKVECHRRLLLLGPKLSKVVTFLRCDNDEWLDSDQGLLASGGLHACLECMYDFEEGVSLYLTSER